MLSSESKMVVRGPNSPALGNRRKLGFRETTEEPREISEEQSPHPPTHTATYTQITQIYMHACCKSYGEV